MQAHISELHPNPYIISYKTKPRQSYNRTNSRTAALKFPQEKNSSSEIQTAVWMKLTYIIQQYVRIVTAQSDKCFQNNEVRKIH